MSADDFAADCEPWYGQQDIDAARAEGLKAGLLKAAAMAEAKAQATDDEGAVFLYALAEEIRSADDKEE